MPKTRESKIRANAKYDSTHCTGLYLKFNNGTDRDILEKLSSVPNRQGYIKSLIRQDITRTCSVPNLVEALLMLKNASPEEYKKALDEVTKEGV